MEAIGAILAKLGISKLAGVVGAALGSAALSLGIPAVRKAVVKGLLKLLKDKLDDLFKMDVSDPAKKEAFMGMVKAMVKYAEVCIPEHGMGEKKMAFVKEQVMKLLPESVADQAVQMIEESLKAVKEELKARE